MLEITVPETELWDEARQEFISIDRTTLKLEHSLVSLSKWESKWLKPFLVKDSKTNEEMYDYIRCMCLNKAVDPKVFNALTADNINAINSYINNPMTATTFGANKKTGISRETVTSELIYYWMIALNIPFECQKWHLNRLLTLIEVCNVKNAPPKKYSQRELMSRNSALNKARRKKYNSKG